AQVPYLGCTAITFVLFPLLGKANAQGDEESGRAMAERALRYALLIIMPVATTLTAAGPGVLAAIFPPAYAGAAGALRILAFSYVACALCSVLCTMLNARGRPMTSAISVGIGALITAGAAWVMVPAWGMTGGAVASLLGMVTSTALAGYALTVQRAVRWPLSSLVRHLVAAGVVTTVGMMVPWPSGTLMARLAGLGGAAVSGVAVLVLLVVLGEIGRAELDLLKGVLKGKSRT
ncbi:MAG: polysaccharide biosynthesis C-terminal domain-containing protein, partial [Myxococcota bacterium]